MRYRLEIAGSIEVTGSPEQMSGKVVQTEYIERFNGSCRLESLKEDCGRRQSDEDDQ
jgi:hypothetical protein